VSSSPPGSNDQGAADSRRRRIIRYLLEHPELDDLQTTGELTFVIGSHPQAGRITVTATFDTYAADRLVSPRSSGVPPVQPVGRASASRPLS
jgi:hypothetical protein